MTAWTDPATITNPQPLLDDLAFLKAAVDALSGGNADVTAFVPVFAVSADGKSLVVTSGATTVTLPLPFGSSFKGAIMNGATYQPQDIVTYLGCAYYVQTTFTSAGAFASELDGHAVVYCSGGIRNRGDWNADTTYNVGDAVAYPVGSVYVWWLIDAAPAGSAPPDVTKPSPAASPYWTALGLGSSPFLATQIKDVVQGETQDVINATLMEEFTALAQQVAQLVTKANQAFAQVKASADNIASINQALGQKVGLPFPLALEQPATS